jgi:hypothetical protein
MSDDRMINAPVDAIDRPIVPRAASMSRRRHLLTLAGALGGALLFGYAIRQAGVSDILDGIRRVGWGLAIVLAIGGARLLLRAMCWRLCTPPRAGLSLRRAWSAFLAGDALGSVTPLGLLASEPAKVFLTRHHLAPREAIASLALETLVYTGSVAAMVATGVAVLLATVELPSAWRAVGAVALVAAAIAAAIAVRLLLRGTWDEERGARPRWRERVAAVRRAILEFSAGHPHRLWAVFALDLLFHALAVIEIYVTLQWLLGSAEATLAQAVVFEALNRVITVVFKFVPFRIGVDEALSGAISPVLALDPVAGVTIAVVRKIRNLFWSGVGLAVAALHN